MLQVEKQHRVTDNSFKLHGKFYTEQVDILISKNQTLKI